MHPTEQIKIIGGLVGTVLFRLIGYTLLGVCMNITLLIVQWDSILIALAMLPEVGLEQARGGISLISVFAFPFLYFLAGQKQGVQKALSTLLNKKKSQVIYWLLYRLHEKRPELFESKNISHEKTIEFIGNTKGYVENTPKLIVLVLTNFVSTVDLAEKLASIINTAKFDDLSGGKKVSAVSEGVSDLIPEDLLHPSMNLPLALLAVNIAVFFL